MPDDKEIKKKDSELDNFIANRKKKSIAIAVILFALVLGFLFHNCSSYHFKYFLDDKLIL
jgi:hypothetical protein